MLPHLVSLDHFRAKVYRSRVALLVLLILLSADPRGPGAQGGQLDQSTTSSAPRTHADDGLPRPQAPSSPHILVPTSLTKGGRQVGSQGLSLVATWVQKVLPIRRRPPPSSLPAENRRRHDGVQPRTAASNPAPEPIGSSSSSSSSSGRDEGGGGAHAPPTAAVDDTSSQERTPAWTGKHAFVGILVQDVPPSRSKTATTTTTTTTTTTDSHVRSTRFSLDVLLSAAVFPTLVQLHLLWLVRFLAGEYEARAAASWRPRSHSHTQPRRRWPTLFLALLLPLLLVATIATTLLPSTRRSLERIGAAWLSPPAAAAAAASQPNSTLFPSTAILATEALSALFSLIPLLIPLVAHRLPTRVALPSPSHAPPLVECIPFCIRAPFMPAERDRVRRAAALRRHGAFAAPPTQPHTRSASAPQPQSGSGDAQSASGIAPATETPLWTQLGSARSREAARVLRLQQDLVDELERAGKLSHAASSRARRAALREAEAEAAAGASASASASGAPGKSSPSHAHAHAHAHARRNRQTATATVTVLLPLSYVASLALTLLSSLGLILAYALVTLSLPNVAPTSMSALVALIALRAEVAGLIATWSEERRRVEGLEFVRRRWGTSEPRVQSHGYDEERIGAHAHDGQRIGAQYDGQHTRADAHDGLDTDAQGFFLPSGGSQVQDDGNPTPSTCAICFESIAWHDEEEDAVRLDCEHELHAPCLVPWLMAQAFCPVCHRALRPGRAGGVGVGGRHTRARSQGGGWAAAQARRETTQRERHAPVQGSASTSATSTAVRLAARWESSGGTTASPSTSTSTRMAEAPLVHAAAVGGASARAPESGEAGYTAAGHAAAAVEKTDPDTQLQFHAAHEQERGEEEGEDSDSDSDSADAQRVDGSLRRAAVRADEVRG